MEVNDGFIKNIYRYCDLWCPRCSLRHRCEAAAGLVSLGKEEAHAYFRGLELMPAALPDGFEAPISPDPDVMAHGDAIREKLRKLRRTGNPTLSDALETIEHFTMITPLKIIRSLAALSSCGREQQYDSQGSAKVALLALERMARSWRLLVDAGCLTEAEVAPFVAELNRLNRLVEYAAPDARSFVRPGFDEPHDVMLLDTTSRH